MKTLCGRGPARGTQITFVINEGEYLTICELSLLNKILNQKYFSHRQLYILLVIFIFFVCGLLIFIYFVSSLFVYSSSSGLGSGSTAPLWIFLGTGVPVHILSLVYLLSGNSVVGLAVSISYE